MSLKHWVVFCLTEGKFVDYYNATAPSTCPNNAVHSINSSSIVSLNDNFATGPGGTGGQLQYNNNGLFSGSAIATDGLNLGMTGTISNGSNNIGLNTTTYLTGTVSQSGTTITGVGTTFTTSMIGGLLTYANGTTVSITNFTSSTSLVCDKSLTVASQTYKLVYGCIHISESGTITLKDSGVYLKNPSNTFTTNIKAGANTANSILTLPTTTDTVVGKSTIDTLTNKTLLSTTNDVAANYIRNGATFVNISASVPSTNQVLSFDGSSASWINYEYPAYSSTISQTIPSTSDKILASAGVTLTLPTNPVKPLINITNSDGGSFGSNQIVIKTSSGTINNLNNSTVSGAWINNPYGSLSLVYNSTSGNWNTIGNYGMGRLSLYLNTSYNIAAGNAHRFDTYIEPLSGIFSNPNYFKAFGVGLGTTGCAFYNLSGKTQVWQVEAGMYVNVSNGASGIFDIAIQSVVNDGGIGTFGGMAEAENLNYTGNVGAGAPIANTISKVIKVDSANGIRISDYASGVFGNFTFSPNSTSTKQNFVTITQIA